MNNQAKFEFDVGTQSELRFKVMIEGTSSETGTNKPEFRFVLSEHSENSKGYMFPASRDGNVVSVIIPENTPGISLGKSYHGRLEVVMGNILMIPSEVSVAFKKAKVSVVAEVEKSNGNSLNESDSEIFEAIKAIISNNKPEIKKAPVAVTAPIAEKKKAIVQEAAFELEIEDDPVPPKKIMPKKQVPVVRESVKKPAPILKKKTLAEANLNELLNNLF